MSILLLALLYIAPLVFILCMVVLRDSFTLQQAGIITSIFTVIPSIVKILEISCRSKREASWCLLDLRNWLNRQNHKNIVKWFDKNLYGLERFFNASIIFIATSAFFAGLFMQLLATYSNAK